MARGGRFVTRLDIGGRLADRAAVVAAEFLGCCGAGGCAGGPGSLVPVPPRRPRDRHQSTRGPGVVASDDPAGGGADAVGNGGDVDQEGIRAVALAGPRGHVGEHGSEGSIFERRIGGTDRPTDRAGGERGPASGGRTAAAEPIGVGWEAGGGGGGGGGGRGVTDGQSNVGDSPVRVAQQAGKEGVPIYAVAVGTAEGPRNARITELE